MPAFLTEEQIKKIRIKGSKVLKLDSLDGMELRVVKMSSGAQLESQEVQAKVIAKELKQRDFLVFMVRNSCAKMDGELFTEQDANELFDLIPIDDITTIVNTASDLIGASVRVRKVSSAAGETTIDSEPLTPAEKK